MLSSWWNDFCGMVSVVLKFFVCVMVGNLLVVSVCSVKWFLFDWMVRCLLVSDSVIWLLGIVCRMLSSLWVVMVVVIWLLLMLKLVCVVICSFRLVDRNEMFGLFLVISRLVRIGNVWWCLMMLLIVCSGLRRVFCLVLISCIEFFC